MGVDITSPPSAVLASRMCATVAQVVFDGGSLHAKGGTAEKRRLKRAAAIQRAATLTACGRPQEADAVLAQSVTITHDMARELIEALRSVHCIPSGPPHMRASYLTSVYHPTYCVHPSLEA